MFVIIGGILTIVQGSPQLLFANRKDLRLIDAASPKVNLSVVVGNLDDAAAVDFLYSDGMIFWTDINMEMILRTVINGTQRTTERIITTGLVSPDGLACDWLGRKLYWTDAETNRIEVSNLDGSYRKVLYWMDLDQPRAIALDPFHGFMYWTDWGEVPKIERAGMDGSSETRSVIVDDNIYWPNGLTMDYDDEKIFWADAKLSYIHSCDYFGRNRRVIIEGNLPHPFALTLYEQTLFWTDWTTKSIHSCNKTTGMDRKVVFSNIHSPMDIHAYMASRQSASPNPCGSNNGGCSHLCLMSPAEPRYKCACPTGVRLTSDWKTCADGAEEMLLLARRTDLRRISLDTPDFTDVVLQLTNIKHTIALDYDPVDGYVYWTDDEVRTIRRAKLDGKGEEVLISTEVNHPDGIAVDWIGRNLYWTDTGTDRIEVARLNGTARKVLISEGLDEPRAICLDPERGYMYWTDWGEKPKIERASLDGTHRVTIIDSELGWPNGIAVDFTENKIYWADAKTDKIEVANMDGTGRRVLVNQNLPHVFGFSLLGDYIYWTDWQRRSIERVNKRSGQARELIIDQLPDLMGLKAVNVKKAEGTNPCATYNGGCSHLCLFTPDGPVCACPMGLELLSNGKVCIVPEAFLLFTRNSDIKRMSLAADHRVAQIPIKNVQKALAIDFDINDNKIYWADGDRKSISRAFMNGSASETIIEFGVIYPEGMAVDWVAHNIYWVDSGSTRIEVARLDGSSRKVLIWRNLSHPRALALDPPNGYMYWTDWAQPPKLERAWLDGTHRTVILDDIGRVYGFTIDYALGRLYWADIDKTVIESAALDGSNRTVVTKTNVPSPMALTQYQDFLYWADWDLKSIEKANKTSGKNRTTVQYNLDKVMDILVFHHSRQAGWNACNRNNGGCSHLCLARPANSDSNETHICACPTHFELNVDNKTCTAPQSFLLFSQKNEISRLVIEQTDPSSSPDVVLPIKQLRNIRAIDFDPVKKFVYWIGGKSRVIKRAKLNGTQTEALVNDDKVRPFDFAIDPYSQLLFWSCMQNNVINFTRIGEKSGIKGGGVVVNGSKPRYLAINPHKGHLYWTDLVSPPAIRRALYDGTEQIDLFTGLEKPGPITIDHTAGLLFWVDLSLHVIEVSDLSGGNRHTLVQNNIETVVGLAVNQDFLYWVDKDKKLVGRVEKRTGKSPSSVLNRISNLSDLHAATLVTSEDIDRHPCAKNNGNCSHICIAKTSYSAQCSCPNHLVLNEKECSERTTCPPDHYTCVSGNIMCIPRMWHCDGSPDCTDKSDEENCPVCSATEYQCKDGKCISEDLVCDGTPQCVLKDDEDSCCENKDQIKCAKSNKCYDKTKHCDGERDCEDGSDESNCPTEVKVEDIPKFSAHYTVAIIVGVVAIVFIFIIVFACRRKSPDIFDTDRDMIQLTKPLHPQVDVTPQNTLNTRSKCHKNERPQIAMTTLTLGSDSGGNVYDRNHVTGASSSSSAVTQYPKETLNPPPSPVTDRSVCNVEFLSGYSTTTPTPSTIRSFKRHRRRHIRPPPTTPCSTDVCEDSEPYFPKGYYDSSLRDLNYDSSDPYPPPPTPRSHYFSDELSCPDSPITTRSYFTPYDPPPPSPVANSDC